MDIVRTIPELQDKTTRATNEGQKIGFVPTMGALHEGHLSLVEKAKQHADIIIASIFVNPTQFAPHEDFGSYPRHEEEDAKKFKQSGVDILFIPTEDVLYPSGHDTNIKAGKAAQGLETDFRPHFFDGVVNVVHRLLTAVKPDIAVFGEKDFQQLQTIKEMVETLELPITIIGAPIIRDDHGLALSSRNAYLSEEEVKTARQFNIILHDAAKTGDITSAKAALRDLGFDKIDYIETRWNRVLGAAWLGKTRLIDNVPT